MFTALIFSFTFREVMILLSLKILPSFNMPTIYNAFVFEDLIPYKNNILA